MASGRFQLEALPDLDSLIKVMASRGSTAEPNIRTPSGFLPATLCFNISTNAGPSDGVGTQVPLCERIDVSQSRDRWKRLDDVLTMEWSLAPIVTAGSTPKGPREKRYGITLLKWDRF